MLLHLHLLAAACLLQKGAWSQQGAWSHDHYSVIQPEIGDELKFCTSDCGNIRYERIQKVYGKLFLTEEEVSQRYNKKQSMDRTIAYNETDGLDVLPGDGDSCCATKLVYTMNDTLVDMSGNVRTIVHFPPRYQYLPMVTCVATGCRGTCIVEPMHLTLLVYIGSTEKEDYTLEWFALPGYCSCKNIT